MRTTIKFYRVVSLLLVLFCVAAASLTACGLGTTDLGATVIAEKEVGEDLLVAAPQGKKLGKQNIYLLSECLFERGSPLILAWDATRFGIHYSS